MPAQDEVVLFAGRLNAVGADNMITGATAAIIHGQPRVTNDLDVVLRAIVAAESELRRFPTADSGSFPGFGPVLPWRRAAASVWRPMVITVVSPARCVRRLNACGVAAAILVSAAAAEKPPLGLIPTAAGVTMPGLPAVTGHIHVDQFGYLPDEAKIAVVSDPQSGFNAAESCRPGVVLEVRCAAGGAVVFQGRPVAWNGGRVDALSGDRGWWFDFSGVREPGEYYVFDPANDRRSHVFRVGDDVYRGVLRAAVRTFYFQREDTPREAAFAEGPWVDGPMFQQDERARALWAKDDAATERDLRGGWMDAGDSNKYVTFLRDVIHPLLYAWQANPAAFTDDFNIPESGNGRSDLLDEVMFELRWLVRMQDEDGGFFIKMGAVDYAVVWPLSADRRPRYYGPKCSSATIAAAAMLAQAARVYGGFPEWKAEAADFGERALRAWSWYRANPRGTDCDTTEIKSGDADWSLVEQDRAETAAALHLFALTGRDEFHDVFRRGFRGMVQMNERAWHPYGLGHSETLLEYTRLPGADAAVREAILGHLRRASTTRPFLPREADSLYRAWMPAAAFHWGSNNVRATLGCDALGAAIAGVGGAKTPALRQRALDLLHSFHGVNPLGLVYLTNMGAAGGEVSATRIWHDWFPLGSPFAANPAPGFVVGGPNVTFAGVDDGATGSVAWVRAQPPDKAYADINAGFPQNSWELSEPAIYYQAAYIRLLAAFAPPPAE